MPEDTACLCGQVLHIVITVTGIDTTQGRALDDASCLNLQVYELHSYFVTSSISSLTIRPSGLVFSVRMPCPGQFLLMRSPHPKPTSGKGTSLPPCSQQSKPLCPLYM